MEHIIKNHDAAANAIIDPYLRWARAQSWYGVNCGNKLYEWFGRHPVSTSNNKHLIIDNVLLPEQDNRCCYCQKRIVSHADDATIEHIAPRSVTNLNHYFTPRSAGLNSTNVCLTSDYVRRGSPASQYPHHVAYQNFAVACYDCNNKRGNEEIEPLFLFAGIHSEVVYDSYTGEAMWTRDPVYSNLSADSPTIEKIGLNRSMLVAIRIVWAYAKRHSIVPSLLSRRNRDSFLFEALGESLSVAPMMKDDVFYALLDIETDFIWNEFLKFDYFG